MEWVIAWRLLWPIEVSSGGLFWIRSHVLLNLTLRPMENYLLLASHAWGAFVGW